jgi:DnaJ domain
MDPYRTLDIQRGCTRQEAKEAFRAKAMHLHPDRGGDEKAFILLDSAYRLILRELDLGPNNITGSPARAPGTSFPSYSSDPGWDPELIVFVGSPPLARPSKEPDPSWDPEMILLDEPPRSPRPFDPNWDPEVVVLEEPPDPLKTLDLNSVREFCSSWLRDFSNLKNPCKFVFVSARPHYIVATTFLILIVVGLLILIGWTPRGI